MGLIVASASGLVGAPLLGIGSGVALASVGLVQLAVGWRKAAAEIRRMDADAAQSDAERRLTEIKIKRKELELEQAKLEIAGEKAPKTRADHPRPESAEVPRDVVRKLAEQFSMEEAYANHLLNRGLPILRIMKQKMAGVEVSSVRT